MYLACLKLYFTLSIYPFFILNWVAVELASLPADLGREAGLSNVASIYSACTLSCLERRKKVKKTKSILLFHCALSVTTGVIEQDFLLAGNNHMEPRFPSWSCFKTKTKQNERAGRLKMLLFHLLQQLSLFYLNKWQHNFESRSVSRAETRHKHGRGKKKKSENWEIVLLHKWE